MGCNAFQCYGLTTRPLDLINKCFTPVVEVDRWTSEDCNNSSMHVHQTKHYHCSSLVCSNTSLIHFCICCNQSMHKNPQPYPFKLNPVSLQY